MPGDGTMLPTEGASDAPESEYVPAPPDEPAADPDDEVVHAGGMTRRKAVVLGSAIVLLALGLLVGLAIVLGTQTPFGRDYIRSIVLDLTKGMKGRLYIGRIEGNLFTGVRIDSLELRDTQDSVFVATGPITVEYDPRDFLDRRVLLRHVRVERPLVVIKKHEDGTWNYRRLFPSKPSSPRRERGFGDFIRVDSADVVDMRFVLTMPWHPADSLQGARRDSAIRATLSDSAHCTPARCFSETRRDAEGLKRTWRWTDADVALGHVRIADPDTAGRFFRIATLGVDEADPPFRFRNVRGDVRMLKDTAWLELTHFDLPGSTGSARGRVEWGDIETGEPGSAFGRRGCRPMPGKLSCPVRYDILVQGDSVSLADVAWVYPTLPTTGGGRMRLRIRSDTANLNVIDYAISDMDVRSTFSRLRGRMTYGVGGPVLVVKDVAVDALPMDFRLIRQLNGEDFPYPWAGTITGRVVGRGGPLTRFRVDSAHFTFADANVPGARTIGSARGELDILFPAYTAFHGFDVTVDQLDLRTLQYLNPNFPRINGFVAGRATLDSSWLDVRFRDADLTHIDGPGEPSHAAGSGRVTYGEQFMTWDLTIDAQPLSFATLARSYPELPVRASFRGPLRVQGTSEDLDLQADLSGAAGRIVVDGNFDMYPPGFAARRRGRSRASIRTCAATPSPTSTAGSRSTSSGRCSPASASTAARRASPSSPATCASTPSPSRRRRRRSARTVGWASSPAGGTRSPSRSPPIHSAASAGGSRRPSTARRPTRSPASCASRARWPARSTR